MKLGLQKYVILLVFFPRNPREGKTTGQNSSVYKAASQSSEEVFGSGPWNKVKPCSKLWISWRACTRTRTEFPTL